jgi:tetratricopeptide (TPR) repeat protein
MGLWDRLFGRRGSDELAPKRLDYLNEALALERQGDYEAALTSYRLALRDQPADPRVLQNMAIAFTKTNRHDEAIRYYRKALELDHSLAGAHYGLAFLLIKRGDHDAAGKHLKAFLGRPPRGPDAAKWIEHAERALAEVEGSDGPRP